jgi:ribosomal protein S18 acetylase RimI-like enzyme
MEETVQYRFMEPNEETGVCNLVIRVFKEFIAHQYSQEGVREFLKYVQPELLMRRSQTNHFVLLATTQDKIVGMIEIRNNRHVSLLFVDKRFQQRGIGRELLRRSLKICKLEISLKRSPELQEVSVNSSPNSIQIYERIGFRQKGSEQVKNGIRFTQMVLELPKEQRD